MPTLEISRQQVQPIVTPARQLPAGAFQAEARALQGLGEAVRGFGRELGSLSYKIALAQEQDQFDDGILEYAKILDDQDSELTKNRNYSRETFEKAFDERTDKIKSNTKSKGALKRLTKYFARQRIVEGIRTETKIHRIRVAEARLKIPIVVNEYAQKFVEDETLEGQKQTLTSLNEKLGNDVKSGVLSEAEAQDTFRRFTMMAVREHAERDPKRTIEAVRNRASLKGLGLTKEMIASLSAEDLDTLQKDAKSEIEGRSAEIAIADKIAFEEADDEYRNAIIKGDFSDATRLQIINDQRYDNFGKERAALLKWREDWIKDVNENAGKFATPDEKAETRDKFKDLVDSRKFDEAEKYFTEIGWMFTFSENTNLRDYLRKEKAEPSENLLKESIDISKDLTAVRVGFINERKPENQAELVAEEEIKGRKQRKRIREIMTEEGLTPEQKRKQIDAILLPAKEETARDMLGFWGRLLRPKKTTPFFGRFFGTTEEMAIARKRAKAGIEKSPYPEYPDAFKEDGIWKVIRDGKKYRIED